MAIKKLTRIFKKGDKEFTDPNPKMTPSEVLKFYSDDHPELINASITGVEEEGDKAIYTIGNSFGKHG